MYKVKQKNEHISDESAKEIIGNLLSSPHYEEESEIHVMQQANECVTCDQSTHDRNRKLTSKGREYMIETLKHHRDAAKKRLARQIERVNSFVDELEDVKLLTSEAEELDLLKEDLNQAFKQHYDLMETEEDKEASYRCFDLIDREFSEWRLRISSRIHSIERKVFEENPSVKSSRSGGSLSTKSFQLSSSSVRSRKIKAAVKAAKLESEMKYLDKEAELKRIKEMKELEMARAERDAMRALEDEGNVSSIKETKPPCQRIQEQGGFHLDMTPFGPRESTAPLKSEEPCLPTLGVATAANPPSLPPSGPPTLPVKSEVRMDVSPSNPFKSSSSEMPYLPVKMEGQCLGLVKHHLQP